MFWYLSEAPRQGTSNEYQQHMLLWSNWEKSIISALYQWGNILNINAKAQKF